MNLTTFERSTLGGCRLVACVSPAGRKRFFHSLGVAEEGDRDG
jgi:hypothetical protein